MKVSLEQGSCALELNEMGKVSSLKVSLVSILKAMANCNLEQDAKDLSTLATSFLKVLNSMAECMLGLNAMGSNKLDLFAYSAMKVLNKSDLSSYNCSRAQELMPEACAMFH